MRAFPIVLLALAGAALLPAAKNLEIYFIDVEGGQATLFVAPSGESMLIDTVRQQQPGCQPHRRGRQARRCEGHRLPANHPLP